MSLITRNDKGAIAVNNKVIIKLITDRLLEMSDTIILCNKKGKPITRTNPFTGPDYSDAVDYRESKNTIEVTVYLIYRSKVVINDISNSVLDIIEDIFEGFSIKKPDRIKIAYKGVMAAQLEKKNIEVSRRNG